MEAGRGGRGRGRGRGEAVVGRKQATADHSFSEPVWPSGKALGW